MNHMDNQEKNRYLIPPDTRHTLWRGLSGKGFLLLISEFLFVLPLLSHVSLRGFFALLLIPTATVLLIWRWDIDMGGRRVSIWMSLLQMVRYFGGVQVYALRVPPSKNAEKEEGMHGKAKDKTGIRHRQRKAQHSENSSDCGMD